MGAAPHTYGVTPEYLEQTHLCSFKCADLVKAKLAIDEIAGEVGQVLACACVDVESIDNALQLRLKAVVSLGASAQYVKYLTGSYGPFQDSRDDYKDALKLLRDTVATLARCGESDTAAGSHVRAGGCGQSDRRRLPCALGTLPYDACDPRWMG